MNMEKALRSDYPLNAPVTVSLSTVGDFVAVSQAIAGFADWLIQDKNQVDRGMALHLIALQMIDQVNANGWDCGDPDCEDCRGARAVGQKQELVVERKEIDINDPLAGFLLPPRRRFPEGD
jgi:hypothetical protein